MDLEAFKKQSSSNKAENKKFFKRLKRVPPKKLDKSFHTEHNKAFSCIDCLQCANCCKTTGPLFTDRDIKRLAKYLSLKPQVFIETYLRLDEENDYVLKSVPCPFLGDDNYCSVYEHRPKACREYPHTDRDKMFQILELTRKNTTVCPAVHQITEALKQEYK